MVIMPAGIRRSPAQDYSLCMPNRLRQIKQDGLTKKVRSALA
jgi:hypothetical protein